ncbi:MAG TPA: hypothetical protein VFJ70_02620, partial [Burkholderiales bacterium]|nr:hypothetical protein [Burkholderiales bacterium]
GGISMGMLALGAGALGVAAAAGGGGGGSGDGSGGGTSAAPAPTPTPTPMPTMQIHNFGEYTAAINQGGASAATNAIVSPGAAAQVDISGGFSRGALPKMLGDLRPSTGYNVTGASAAAINDGGIVVNLQGNADSSVTAHSDAAAASSNLMWMQTMAVRNFAGQTPTLAKASASASGAGSDAEIGIQHLSMDSTGTGALNGQAELAATAAGGGVAHALAGDVTLHIDSSGVGTSVAPVASQIHMGYGEGDVPGILASASGAGSSATAGVSGNVSLSVHGDDVYAFNSGVFAQGTEGGSAHTDVGGNMSFAADGREAHSYVLVDASTDAAAGSAADVHLHGNVSLESTGTQSALTRAAVRADGAGTVEIDGHLSADSSSPDSSSYIQVIAQGGSGDVSIGSIDMSLHGGGRGWMDLYTDHSGGLNIGTVNLSSADGYDISLHVQNANQPVTGIVDTTFLAHTDGTADVQIGTANLGGGGEIHMFLNSQTFGTINQAAGVTGLDVHYQLADQGFSGVGSAPLTTINGFSAGHDDVIYNGVSADDTNFANAGSFDSLTALNAGLDAALDGTHKYVFAVYNGTEDINHNGVADDHGAGILAWDDNGTGITSALMLPGVTALAASDIAWQPAPPPPPPPVG